MRMHPRAFIIGTICLILTDVLDVLTPLALKYGIDAIQEKNPSNLIEAIVFYALVMTGVTAFRFGWRINFGRFHHSVAEDLRNKIFSKYTELGPSFYQRSPIGRLMSLLTNDVNSFRMAIGPGLLILIDACALLAFTIPLMISLSWSWTWKSLLFMPFIPFVMRKLETLIHERFKVQQERLADVSSSAQEIVSGVRIIKSFAQEKNQLISFNSLSKKFEDACNGVTRLDAAFLPVMRSGSILGGALFLAVGAPEVIAGTISVGTFVAFHEYVKRTVWPMSAIGMCMSMIEQGRASFDRISELLGTETDIPDTGEIELKEFESIEIRNLSFRYPGSNVDALSNINLKINAGETIGIVGPVGAGKTTLLQLMCRMYPTAPESVLINGSDVASIKRSSLSKTISYVTQDVFLFSDTIAENVALGLQEFPGLQPIEEATGLVNIDREIREIPQGYDAYLGERGVNFSGGQKQRLTIARAMIRRSPVVMLDDSLSAVDGKTEKMITSELQSKTGQSTVLLVSHRLATLMHANRIVVLNKGKIIAVGPHEELLQTCSIYRELHQMQSSAGGSDDRVRAPLPTGETV